MIDPLLSLAFSMQSNKGGYALLLGSGVSRSAGIPTGWEIVLDLIQKLARSLGEPCTPDPETWYKVKYGEPLRYDMLLDSLAGTATERSQLIRPYFEPTEDERRDGRKVPTAGHKAIADLCMSGHVRVIITTNFDRLIEQAIEQRGITPTVLATPDSISGALPLVHQRCCVFKIHGDYMDTRIRNTPEELGAYDPRINTLLDRILDEFGLIVCGWSAEWDLALYNAIEHCPSRRFTTYWAAKSDPIGRAKSLVGLRNATPLKIKDADSFFTEVRDKVIALGDIEPTHPLSAKVSVATAKRYLSNPSDSIRMHDLVMDSVDEVLEAISADRFSSHRPEVSAPELVNREQAYRSIVEPLLGLMATGAFWGNNVHDAYWISALERLANPSGEQAGLIAWLRMRRYPALLAMYVSGIAALAKGRFDLVAEIVSRPVVRDIGKESPMILAVNSVHVVEPDLCRLLPGRESDKTPTSNHLHNVLRVALSDCIRDDSKYTRMFDKFEYLSALLHADIYERQRGHIWAPIGSYAWRCPYEDGGLERLHADLVASGALHALLSVGYFKESTDRLAEMKKHVFELAVNLGSR